MAKRIKKCRVCGSTKLIDILSLGSHAVSDFVKSSSTQIKAPLSLVLCDPTDGGCSLLQLKHEAVDPSLMYRNYWYKSGMNSTMTHALADITNSVEEIISFKKGDMVLDIGANDGTLLRQYKNKKIKLVGFEPARNLQSDAKKGTDLIINDFFNYKSFLKKFDSKTKAKVVTSIAMFYDLEDPNTFVHDLTEVLDKDGIWIIQMAYLPLMLEKNNFDNICHEHVEYYSLTSLEKLLQRHNLEIFDVELNDVNGGSFRIYIKKNTGKVVPINGAAKRVKNLFDYEKKLGLHKITIYKQFARRVEKIKKELVSFIKKVKKQGKKVHVYGASTKGNTLLQYFSLDASLIEAAAERNKDKWGLKTVATDIPIISEEESRKTNPDYYLVLPWHFREEFLEREKEYMGKGGKMIFPLPIFEIITIKNNKLVSIHRR